MMKTEGVLNEIYNFYDFDEIDQCDYQEAYDRLIEDIENPESPELWGGSFIDNNTGKKYYILADGALTSGGKYIVESID